MLCVNVQSLLSNLPQIELLLAESQPYMLFCTEARVTTEINDAEITIDGYNILRSDSISRHSGGVVLYYRSDMDVVKLANHVQGYSNILTIIVVVFGLEYITRPDHLTPIF